MKFSALVLSSTFSVLGLTASGQALAHIQLISPTPRVANTDSIKSTPCGPATRNAAKVTTAKPGETITVQWDETISHPGYFRILFDEDGQDGLMKPTMASFKLYSDYYNGQRNGITVDKLPKLISATTKDGGAWVLADNWGLHASGAKRPWMLKVTLPNVTCNNCTLQVVQGMFENSRTYDGAYYFHCADFILKGDAAPATDGGTTPTADAGVPPGTGGQGGSASNAGGQGGKAAGGSAGSSGGQGGTNASGGSAGSSAGNEGGNAGSGENLDKSSGGGCSFAGRTTGLAGSLFLAVAALFLARRRRS